MIRFGFTTPARARAAIADRIRDAGGVRAFPRLSQMVTFPDWVLLAGRLPQEAFYGFAGTATERLIERHGLEKVIEYFQLFALSDDRLDNFRRAFGQDFTEFEAAFMETFGR